MYRLIAALLIAAPLCATDYHVDHSSSQTVEDGSAASPFKTIAQATDVMSAGDTCYIHQGIYQETIVPGQSGSEIAPIRYVAYEDDTVVISATSRVTDWEIHSGSIYKATNIDMPLGDQNMVFFDSDAQQLARWPNDLDGAPFTFDAYKIQTAAGTYSNSYITHDEIPDYWTDGVLFWLGAHSGCAVQREITGYDSASNRLSFTPFPDYWPFGTHSPTRFENGHRGIFYLLNKLEALDAPGEWYYDTTARTLYFYAPEGVDPSTGIVEVATRNRTINNTRNYIEFDKLNFFGGPLQLNGSHTQLTNSRIRNCVAGLITNHDSATAGGAAILVNGDNIRIEQCLIEEGSATGVNIAGTAENATVENCIIRNFNTQGNHTSPLRSGGPGANITRNKVYGSARDCTRVTGANSVFSYNDVSKGLLANTDGGLFYVTGNSTPVNVELHHNWFYDVHSPDYTSGHSTGIYLDNNSAGYIVHHNVVWDVEWGALHFNWDALQNEIYNNSFWDLGTDYATILSWIPERNGVRTDVRDNILINNISDVRQWWDSGAGSYVEDETLDNTFTTNIQTASSPFVSITNKDFTPTSQSALVDQGETIAGITDGHIGSAPDIGAYEFGGTRWIPGPDWEPTSFSWTSLSSTTFTNWIGRFDVSGDDALYDSDPDLDGFSNFHEYANGGDPTDPSDRGFTPRISIEENTLSFTYAKRKDSQDITYRLESNDTLSPENWTTAGTVATNNLNADYNSLSKEISMDSAPNFLRLRIEKNAP